MQHETELNVESEKRLIFALGTELYGCSVLKVREIIKLGAIKPVPYMTKYFKGVQNVRGQVLGVIDLGAKLGISRATETSPMIVVTETQYGTIGVVVDQLVAVADFPPSAVDATVQVSTKIAPVFFDGIGKWNDRLVHLIDLSGLVQEEDFRLTGT